MSLGTYFYFYKFQDPLKTILFIHNACNLGLLSIWQNKLVLEAHLLNQRFRNIPKAPKCCFITLKFTIFSPLHNDISFIMITFFYGITYANSVVIKCFQVFIILTITLRRWYTLTGAGKWEDSERLSIIPKINHTAQKQ